MLQVLSQKSNLIESSARDIIMELSNRVHPQSINSELRLAFESLKPWFKKPKAH
jgi:hypothetical protein